MTREDYEPPEFAPDELTFIDLSHPSDDLKAEVQGRWPGKTAVGDRITMRIAGSVGVHGTPEELANFGADVMVKARAAERAMLTERVAEGRAGSAPEPIANPFPERAETLANDPTNWTPSL